MLHVLLEESSGRLNPASAVWHNFISPIMDVGCVGSMMVVSMMVVSMMCINGAALTVCVSVDCTHCVSMVLHSLCINGTALTVNTGTALTVNTGTALTVNTGTALTVNTGTALTVNTGTALTVYQWYRTNLPVPPSPAHLF
jgi:hypothetical protein